MNKKPSLLERMFLIVMSADPESRDSRWRHEEWNRKLAEIKAQEEANQK